MITNQTGNTIREWTRNQRRSPWARICMHVKVWRCIQGEKKLLPGYCRGISEDSIAVFIPAGIPLDEKLELQFTLPRSTRELTIQTIVNMSNKFDYRLEFTSLDAGAKDILKHVVSSEQMAGGQKPTGVTGGNA
jgi:hypothetical protein